MENNRKGCINRDKNGCKTYKKYSTFIWKKEKDMKSIEENTKIIKVSNR